MKRAALAATAGPDAAVCCREWAVWTGAAAIGRLTAFVVRSVCNRRCWAGCQGDLQDERQELMRWQGAWLLQPAPMPEGAAAVMLDPHAQLAALRAGRCS